MINTPLREGNERISHRSPDSSKFKITPKIQEIYNSLAEYKRNLKEHEQYKDIYTAEVLYKILEKKANKQLNPQIFQELNERIRPQMGSRGDFNIYEWIKVYIEAEDVLNAKIEKYKMDISAYEQKEVQLQSWLEAESHNIQNQSQSRQKSLWINVLEGEIVNGQQKLSFKAPPYVRITYGTESLQSKPAEDLVKPVWNKLYKIPLQQNEKSVTISVLDIHQHSYGQQKLVVDHFGDQKKRKEYLYLSNNNKSDGNSAKISVSIVTLYSELETIQNQIAENEIQMNEANNNLIEFQKMLTDLYAPFESLGFGEFRASALNQSGRPSIFAPDVKVSRTEKELIERLTMATNKYISNWTLFYYILSIFIILLSLLCNFARVSFIDVSIERILLSLQRRKFFEWRSHEVVIIIFIYAESVSETLTQMHMRVGVGLGLLSLIYDLIWAFSNSKDWCSTFQVTPGCSVINFVVWITWILILLKTIWCLALWRNSAAFDDYKERSQLLLNKQRATMGLNPVN